MSSGTGFGGPEIAGCIIFAIAVGSSVVYCAKPNCISRRLSRPIRNRDDLEACYESIELGAVTPSTWKALNPVYYFVKRNDRDRLVQTTISLGDTSPLKQAKPLISAQPTKPSRDIVSSESSSLAHQSPQANPSAHAALWEKPDRPIQGDGIMQNTNLDPDNKLVQRSSDKQIPSTKKSCNIPKEPKTPDKAKLSEPKTPKLPITPNRVKLSESKTQPAQVDRPKITPRRKLTVEERLNKIIARIQNVIQPDSEDLLQYDRPHMGQHARQLMELIKLTRTDLTNDDLWDSPDAKVNLARRKLAQEIEDLEMTLMKRFRKRGS